MRLCQGKVQAYKSPNALIWYANVYGIPVIAVLGVLGNIINCVVLAANGKRIPSYVYLLAISISDCLFLIFGTFEVTPITFEALSSDPTFNRFYTRVVLYCRIASSAAFKYSVLLVVAFNVERYISVCHPLHANDVCGKKLNRWRMFFAWMCCLLLSVHWPLTYVEDRCFDQSTNATFYMVRLNADQSARSYEHAMNYVSMICFNIVPIVILFILNVLIIRTLRAVIRKDRMARLTAGDQSGSASQHSQQRTQSRGANTMLFAVVVMFLICNGPQVPGRLLLDRLGPTDALVQTYVAVSQQLIFLNASLNFCLYCLVSRRYRSLLMKTWSQLRHRLSLRMAYNAIGSKWLAWRESLRLRRSSHSSRRGIVEGAAAVAVVVDAAHCDDADDDEDTPHEHL